MPVTRFFHERPTDGRAYGFLRIAFGLVAVLSLLTVRPLLSLFYGSDAVCPSDFPAFLGSTGAVRAVWGIGIASALLMAAGAFVRAVSILTYLALAFFFLTPCRPDNYGDQILVATAFLMIFAPGRDPMSLDARWLGRRGADFSPWLHKTLRLFAGTLYLVPVLIRLGGAKWWDGTAAWAALADPSTSRVWQALSRDPWILPAWAYAAITYGSLAFEALFPFLVWVRRLRPFLVGAGIVFHLGMGVVLDLGLFPFQMAVVLIGCLDVTPSGSRGRLRGP
ncbi:MAG TPA: HTTM domain-containing protein [bacterium]|nr:HTTM domain-containing protein [bacterium]